MVEVRIGDIITTDTTFFGSPITYRLTIKTQDAANYATELVNKPNASFKLERSAQETRSEPTAEGALKELRERVGLEENPCITGYWFCARCRLCNCETVHHTSCPTCGGLRPTANR